MVDIALIIPDAPFLLEPRGFPHLGVLYISAALKEVYYNPKVYDLTGGVKLPKINADIVGITATSPLFKSAISIKNEIKEYNPEACFIIGGPHATVSPETCRDAGFNFIIAGEGECEILNIVDYYNKYLSMPSEYHGLIVWPKLIENIDTLSFPDRDAIDMDSYHYYLLGEKCTNIQAQRGCPYGCVYCCGRDTKTYRIARQRSVFNVECEIALLKSKYGIKSLMFFDDEFNLNREHTLKMCAMLKRLDVTWRAMIRSNLFDEELAKTMADSGCKELGCGVETGSLTIKKNIQKQTTPEQDLEARELCRKYDIKFKCFIVVGLPGETLETFNETRKWIKKAQPDNLDYTVLTPYPGSVIWNHPEQFDIKFDKEEIIRNSFDGTYYKGSSGGPARSFVSTSALSEADIMRLRQELEDEFPRMASSPWAGTEIKEGSA